MKKRIRWMQQQERMLELRKVAESVVVARKTSASCRKSRC